MPVVPTWLLLSLDLFRTSDLPSQQAKPGYVAAEIATSAGAYLSIVRLVLVRLTSMQRTLPTWCLASALGMTAGAAQQVEYRPPSTVKDQAQAARILREGPDELRVDAQVRITITPPAQRAPATWQAVAEEVARIVMCERKNPENPSSSPGCALAGGPENAYFEDLVRILGEWDDPAAIPSLLLVVDKGGINALARFGDAALPDLLRLARQDRSSGAMFALSRMQQFPAGTGLPPLSQSGRRQVLQFAQEAMREIASRGVIPVVNLALATGDEALRKDVEQLASDADEWRRRGFADQARIEQAMRQVQAQLRLK